MGLFGMLEDDEAAAIPIPKLNEINRADRMLMEKETTGIYLSGHPMDDYRHLLKNTYVIPMGRLLDEESTYQDDQIVSVAGIVQAVKMKTTRNNSMMAYVTVEDDTAAIAEKAGAVVRNEYKQGKGNVIRRMFREIDAECYIMVDGDDTYPADCAREMVDLVLQKKENHLVLQY